MRSVSWGGPKHRGVRGLACSCSWRRGDGARGDVGRGRGRRCRVHAELRPEVEMSCVCNSPTFARDRESPPSASHWRCEVAVTPLSPFCCSSYSAGRQRVRLIAGRPCRGANSATSTRAARALSATTSTVRETESATKAACMRALHDSPERLTSVLCCGLLRAPQLQSASRAIPRTPPTSAACSGAKSCTRRRRARSVRAEAATAAWA